MQPTTAPIDPSAPWRRVAEHLQRHPHQWWQVVTESTTRATAKDTARRITHGKLAAFRPAGHFEGSADLLTIKAIYHGPRCRFAITRERRDCTCQGREP